MNDLGLTIAVPRGALMNDTLDILDGLGLDTAEVRSNDRKLLFADVGVVTRTCSPSRPAATSTSCSTSASAAA